MLYFRDRKKRCKRLTRQLTRKCSGFYLSQGAASSVIRSFSQAPSSVLTTGHRSPRRWCRSFPAGASPSSSTTSAEALRLLERSLAIDLSFRNPNQVGFKFQNSSALLDYRGNDISEAPFPAGQIYAGETLTLTVMADRQIYEEYLDDPVIKGKKNELEKFVGGYYTTSVEAMLLSQIQGVTFNVQHHTT